MADPVDGDDRFTRSKEDENPSVITVAPKRRETALVHRRRALAALLVLVAVLALIIGRHLGFTLAPGSSISPHDREAEVAAQEFLRLVADSRHNDETAPLPCTRVTGPSGFLNPCMDALKERWPELEPIEKIGPKLTVRSLTSSTITTAVVTDADISPRPDAPISITLEHEGLDKSWWKVRQLNQRDLPS